MTSTPLGPASSRTGRGRHMRAEIHEQPHVLTRQFETELGNIRAVAAAVRDTDPRFALIAARGTSDHAALYVKYLIETQLGIPCGLASLSTYTGYAARPRLERCLWLAISQSGGSPDLIESTRVAGRHGAMTVAVTNAPVSALAATAQWHVDIRAGVERSVAATKTYTAELQALWLLVDAWRGRDGASARGLPEELTHLLGQDLPPWADGHRLIQRLVTVGRGFSYPTAREGALKMMETSYLAAQAFSGADLMHGPLAMLDVDQSAIIVVPPGVGGELLGPVVEHIRQTGADTLVVGDRDFAARHGHPAVIPVGTDVPEELSPILQIVPLQRLALDLSIARGLDPDEPRGLSKVTRTT